ncbi:MAG: AzlD domain-containing protein [Sedimenticola sp.]|uniref:AzlD domain-containing protein n=1 Tax=Sedimenticola thiotaurini TaxID=1543721 RepID=A0A558D0G8_9GAMM|nr:AzlD domain-containing protein [Sedimenticola sp.]TVT54511.1 MAG: AzlD domain-containing protein [Sedimenticola thiotaurini]MCW8948053.1 AzlD domain-containing protein [Sedimenticola sp.]MCW8949115.1 AzlD domain-containing protein [Sedimenticola sp.]MCW8974479.1 AzlD domain-containing protein [Sedimenticola sp.]
MLSTWTVWIVIISLGVGTYLIRFSFLGLIGGRELPEWVLRHLRYVAVAVMPALITPLVIWPEATAGEPDPSRLTAAIAAFVIGIRFNSVIGAILGGMVTLYGMQYLLG